MRIAARQRERADRLARFRRNSRDHLVNAKLRDTQIVLRPSQRAPRFGVAFRNGVEQSPANKSCAEDGLAISVVRVAALRSHHATGRRTAPRALFVAAAADVEDAAQREETVERRDQFFTGQPVLGIRLGLQPFSFSAGAPRAEHGLALVARFAEHAEAERLIATRGTYAAAISFCRDLYHLSDFLPT